MTLIRPIRRTVVSTFSGRADTEAYIDRVEADGGVVIDKPWTDSCFQWADDNNITDFGNTYAWISAGAGVKKDGSNKIIKMYSLSGASWDVEQTTASNRPTWTDNHINGNPSIVFDSANSEHLDDVTAQNFLGQRNRMALVGGASTGQFFDGNSSFERGATNFELKAGSTWGPRSADSNNHIFSMEFGGSNSKFYLDNLSVVSGNPGTGHFNHIRLGNNLNGNIAEYVFGDDISTFGILSHMNGRYGIY